MPITLADTDVRAVLDVAEGARQVQPTVDSVQELLALVAELVRCDRRAWNRSQVAPTRAVLVEIATPESGGGFPDHLTEARDIERAPQRLVTLAPDRDLKCTPDFASEWERHRPEHPIMSGQHGPVVSTSDVYPSNFHTTWLYNEIFRVVGLEHEIGVHLSHPADQLHVIYLNRGPGRDFDERDHLVLRLLRPHLDAAFRRIGFTPPRLTPREVDVLRLVRDGLTNQQIARRLQVRETTVAKHLEHVYARTGARSRLQALETARALLD